MKHLTLCFYVLGAYLNPISMGEMEEEITGHYIYLEIIIFWRFLTYSVHNSGIQLDPLIEIFLTRTYVS